MRPAPASLASSVEIYCASEVQVRRRQVLHGLRLTVVVLVMEPS